jgi:hypothetical protein
MFRRKGGTTMGVTTEMFERDVLSRALTRPPVVVDFRAAVVAAAGLDCCST